MTLDGQPPRTLRGGMKGTIEWTERIRVPTVVADASGRRDDQSVCGSALMR